MIARTIVKTALLSASFVLAACGSTTKQDATLPVSPMTPQAAALGPDEVLSRVGSLRAQALDAGECGMFLWLKREDAPLVFFQKSDGAATMVVDGAVTQITRDSVSRTLAYQFYERQYFSHDDLAVEVTVTPEAKRSLHRGLKLPAGSIALKTGEGWSAVLPVAGVIGCK